MNSLVGGFRPVAGEALGLELLEDGKLLTGTLLGVFFGLLGAGFVAGGLVDADGVKDGTNVLAVGLNVNAFAVADNLDIMM